ncbi:GTP:AMP phosphotransferase ak3, mitochondrial [Clydaea vesicula]|uniref:GTP:AMP phosphotransferase ak3, mitochondrial n=1 Tax=Clydaea vesicula TaxID=447962 RepID=A0AAD5XY56_9FUNG|nr:GTP:AMP phosphotransferase ak3, mitochondrial [Clydaea vesicula]
MNTWCELVNDDLAVRVVFEELKKFSKENWLLDGFPRTLGQAKKLDESLNEVNHPLDLVLNLDVPEDIILKRIVDRYIHPASGRTYNLNFNPPRRHGFDDLTGEKLVKREDDDIKIVKKRIRTYHLSTEPLLDYYRQKGVLKNFVGKTSAEIFPKLEKVLIDYNSKILIYYDKTQKAAGKPTILT